MLTRLQPILLVPPSWIPKADGFRASNFADYRTEGSANRYWNNNTQWMNAASWWASRGSGTTFARASLAFGVPATGLLASYASNAARRPIVDPASISKGLGMQYEGARTNVLTQSQTFSTWTTNQASITTNAATAPDGTATATSFVDTASNSFHRVISSASLSANTTYAFSVFAKQGALTQIALVGADASGFSNGASVGFDLSNGTIPGGHTPSTFGSGYTAGAATIKSYGNGWYLLTFVFTTSSSTASVLLQLGFASYSGAATGIYIWGAQAEAAAFPSSYIATTTGSVARAADSQSLTRTAPTSLTKVIAFRTPIAIPSAGSTLYDLTDGSLDQNAIQLRYSSAGHVRIPIDVASVQVANLDLGAVGTNTDVVVAIRISSGGYAASLSGGAAVTSAASGFPSGITTEVEGNYADGSAAAFATIKGTAEWTNFAASNAALQALSGSSYWN